MKKAALVYGFEPFGGYAENVTESVIRSLAHRRDIATEVFAVRFDRRMFADALDRWSPQTIIGLGQHGRARKLRLERRAVNLWAERGRSPVSIAEGAPRYRYASFGLPKTSETVVTYDAGTYVCNFSMYLMAEHCETSGARFAFIHVPRNYNPEKAVKYVSMALDGSGATE